jgi:hypothetical protein
MGLLVASSFAAAQEGAVPKDFLFGSASVSLLGRDNVDSSKFQEYRDFGKGVRAPEFSLVGSKRGIDFTLFGEKVRQQDQRYFGSLEMGLGAVRFDYNQTPHNMGNNGRTIYAQTAPGVWSLSPTLRQAFGSIADAKMPTTTRNFDFYTGLLSPSFAAANTIDLTSLRKRGVVELDLSKNLPIDLAVSYSREVKSGSRTAGGADILGAVSPVIDLPEPLNDLTQDYGIRAAYNFKAGNVHASFNRNIYDNRAETLIMDNPFMPGDVAYTAAVGTTIPPLGGPGRAMVVNAPDNEASTGKFGFMLKFKKQTRLWGDVGLSSWTQNAAFYPYTINSAVRTTAGAAANTVAALQMPSLNGKINTTSMNFAFSTRPVDGLGIRLRYRSYDLANKTSRWVITGDMSGSPDRSWGTVTASADAPFGHATANIYDTKTQRFEGIVSYDFKAFTIEGAGRWAKLERTSREAESGNDNGYSVSALYHATDWLGFRAMLDQTKRTAEGHTIYGFQMDEAERKLTRTGVDVEISPMDSVSLTFAYFRRNVDFTGRPDRVPVSGGVQIAGTSAFPGTPSGLLETSYDSYTGEIEFNPSERVELSAYYSYEKDAQTNQWSTTQGSATVGYSLNNLLNYAGSEKVNSVGANGVFHLVPEKWTLTLFGSYQKVDGLMDITAREAGSFYTPGRTTLIAAGQGGAADINDWDDTKLATFGTRLDYGINKAWMLSVGYLYEDYTFSDAFTSGTALMPQSILIFMKANDGSYTANVGYARLSYRF